MLKGKQNVVDLGTETYLCSLSFLSTRKKTFGKKILAKIRKQQPKTTEKYRSLKALAEQIDFKR